jgi:RNA polymerase sigma factor (sigma-70 family)
MDRSGCNEDRTTTTFLNALKSGANDAWTRFLSNYEPGVRAMCRASIPDENDVDEIVEKVVTKLLVYVKQFSRRPDGRFRNYVRAVTWSQIQDYHRSKKRQATSLVQSPVFGQQYPDRLLHEAISHVRRKRRFSNSSWRAFELYVQEVRSYQVIGERLDQHPEAVRKAIRRIIAAVHDELASSQRPPT